MSNIIRLQPSHLSDQRELLAHDLDLTALDLTLRGQPGFSIVEAIVAGDLTRTIEGASQVTLTVVDRDLVLLRSNYLGKGIDIRIDGLWFRLTAVSRQPGRQLQLTFEDREVALLRSYPRADEPNAGHRTTKVTLTTRTAFAKRLIDDVKELVIPFKCPALDGPPVASADQTTRDVARAPGFAPSSKVTVKDSPASPQQLANINRVLATGASLGLGVSVVQGRDILVAAVMTITQEASALTAATNGVHVGLFQQDPRYWPATRDPETDGRAWLQAAIMERKKNPSEPLAQLIEAVQQSGQGSLYAQHQPEAEATVSSWGLDAPAAAAATANSAAQAVIAAAGGKGSYTRGTVRTINGTPMFTKEDNWDCLGRLAKEVRWHRFCVSGTVHFISDDDLMKSRPRMTISDDTDGVVDIGFDFDARRKRLDKQAQVTVSCRIDRWDAPLGTVVVLADTGIADGKWLVTTISRSLFDAAGTITLKKKQPELPESQSPERRTVGGGPTVFAGSGTVPAAPVSIVTGGAASIATQLLAKLGHGWSDDNGRGAQQIRKVAAGGQLAGAQGPASLDARTMKAVLWLIEQGYTIGTYSWCEDHSDDGASGHTGGHAVDISSVNGISVASATPQAYTNTLAVAQALHDAPAELAPRQLICGGYGNHRDPVISALSIPAADAYYGFTVMGEHTNHIHLGY